MRFTQNDFEAPKNMLEKSENFTRRRPAIVLSGGCRANGDSGGAIFRHAGGDFNFFSF